MLDGRARPAPRHLHDVDDLDDAELERVLARADDLVGVRAPGRSLEGLAVACVFFEASTRTRASFELAAKRVGAKVVQLGGSGTSAEKGETLVDTANNLVAMGVDVLVVRTSTSGATYDLARRTTAAVVNAGDGLHAHPSQALLDALTLRRSKGRLAGLVVAICGDIQHSRVARSNARLLGRLGAEVRLVGPRTLLPPAAESLGPTVRVFDRLDAGLDGADAVMMLRIQHERLGAQVIPSAREHARTFGLDERALRLAKPDCVVLHPGPINRGVELTSALADGPRSLVLEQVTNGVAVRMALLEHAVGRLPS